MKIAVIGAGYVGLVTATCFAGFGHDVVCVDKDESRISNLKKGVMPIYEPGLAERISEAGPSIMFTGDTHAAVQDAELVFIAVGTPPRKTDGHADLSYVKAVAAEISTLVPDGIVVVTKSTVPVGTGDDIEGIMSSLNPGLEFHVASNPEFLREGTALDDFMNPDRVVVGTESDYARRKLENLYSPLSDKGVPVIFTNRRSAELIKYAANAFLAMKITYINEIARLCEALGSDVRTVAKGIGTDSRIGEKFLQAGPGYGGSCFPKDTLALVKTAQDARAPIRLVEATTFINEQHKRAMAFKVVDACGGSVRGKTIAVFGLTFKANTDDMRESPAIAIIQALQDYGAAVRAYDPEGMKNAKAILEDVAFAEDAYTAAAGADAVVVVTEWTEFKSIDLVKLAGVMKGRSLLDLRNLFSNEQAKQSGLKLVGVGRP